MSIPNHIAISFLAVKPSDFTFTIYRKELKADQTSAPGVRWLPVDCAATGGLRDQNTFRYVVKLDPQDEYEEITIRAWVNPNLTQEVLYQALLNRAAASGLCQNIERSEHAFVHKIDFILRRHGDVREVMSLRPFALRALSRFGFLCKFALRVPDKSSLSEKRRLELSLTHKNGHINEDFFLDQYQKINIFLSTYFSTIHKLKLHDGSEIEFESKLSVIPSFTLSTRTYVFGDKRQGKNQFFGIRDHAPLRLPQVNTKLVFIFQAIDRARSQDLFRALRGDTYSTFPGMEKMFRIPINKSNVAGIEVVNFGKDELERICSLLKQRYPHEQILPVAIVPFSKHVSNEETLNYFKAKHVFLSHGFASQFIDRNRFNDHNTLKWSISNIGLAVFVKMGGIPWQIVPSTEKCLIVGIGQSHIIVDNEIKKYIAYSILTDSSGIYEKIKVLGNSANPQEYLESLKTELQHVLLSHSKDYKSFVLHLTFKMRYEEINAIRELLEELKRSDVASHEFITIKFNDSNHFFGFSIDHNSRAPYEGTVAPLSEQDYLMWFSGVSMVGKKAPKHPEPPVHIKILYPKEPLNEADIKRLLQDAMNIAGANWRGFNGRSMPISVYYAKLIADYYAHFRQANLPEVNMDNLPPWFL